MHQRISTQPFVAPWFESAVFGLDRWLRRRQGVFEYVDDNTCLFRIQRVRADCHFTLSDGTHVAPGESILDLHLWNEHMPAIGTDGESIRWGREIVRLIDVSLKQLVRYLTQHRAFDEITVLRADMRLGVAERSEQLSRLAGRFGFEAVNGGALVETGSLHRVGENILIFLLVMASNPGAIRVPVLWRARTPVYLSRAVLERRYATCENRQQGRVGAGYVAGV